MSGHHDMERRRRLPHLFAGLMLLILTVPALSAEFNDRATPFDGPDGCTCSQDGQVWPCRTVVDTACTGFEEPGPALLCPDDQHASCIWRPPVCRTVATYELCIKGDRPQ